MLRGPAFFERGLFLQAFFDSIAGALSLPGAQGWITLIVGLVAATIAIVGIRTQRDIARKRATLDVILRSEADKDLIEARRRFTQLAHEPNGLLPAAAIENEGSADTEAIKIVLNEFELIAIGIDCGILDEHLYREWFRTGLLRHWKHAHPFIEELRRRTNNRLIYKEFEALKNRLAREDGKG